MQPYINLFIFLISTQLVIFIRKVINRRKDYDFFLFVIYSIVLCLFVSTRLKTVGTDTSSYVDFFHDSKFYYMDTPTDWMFEMLGRFFHIFNSSTEWFIFWSGLFSMSGIIFLVKKYAINKSISLIWFTIAGTTFVFLHLYLNVIRQCCAITFYVIAVYFFFQEKQTTKSLYCSILFYILSCLTHGSCLFSFPFIIIAKYHPIYKKKYWYILIIGSYILSALQISFVKEFLQFIFNIIGDSSHYSNYADINFGEVELSGNHWFNMYLLPYTIIGCILLYFCSKSDIRKWWLQITLMGIAMTNLFSDNLMWGRLLLYLTVFSIIAIPNIMNNQKKNIQIIFYLIVFSYFIYKNINILSWQMVSKKLLNINTNVPYKSWFFDWFQF